jgi:hypothetical protein
MDDIPYLLRGINPVSTASSVLISSSRYLNNAKLRDWVATELLRRNGPDVPTPSGAYRLNAIMKEIQDPEAIDALFAISSRATSRRAISNIGRCAASRTTISSIFWAAAASIRSGSWCPACSS